MQKSAHFSKVGILIERGDIFLKVSILIERGCIKHVLGVAPALRVPPAETRLTVYRRLSILPPPQRAVGWLSTYVFPDSVQKFTALQGKRFKQFPLAGQELPL